MLVVSDTSPVTSLLQIGQGALLASLFGQVLVPPAVEEELLRFHSSLPGYLEIRSVRDQQAAEVLAHDLDRGEAEAIVLAQECGAEYVLMDDRRGRLAAEARGLQVIGLLGVLLIAKKSRFIPAVGPVIADLEMRAGFFVSETVKQVILTAAGEAR